MNEENEQVKQNELNEQSEEQERPLTREELYNDYMLRFTGQKAKNWHANYRAMKVAATKVPENEVKNVCSRSWVRNILYQRQGSNRRCSDNPNNRI